MKKVRTEKKTTLKIVLFAVVFVITLSIATFLLWPYIKNLSNAECRETIKKWVSERGIFGIATLLGLQVLQVVIAFIPGEAVEIVSGALYGAIGGFVICTVGCILATLAIFAFSKRFGKRLLNRIFGADKVSNWHWLENSKCHTLVVFILFLVPATPKDMLTYFVGITDMGIGRFILISSIARIPSVLTSTMIGANVMNGNFLTSLLIFVITGAIGILGILLKDTVITYCRSKS